MNIKNLWKIYRQSDECKQLVNTFNPEPEDLADGLNAIFDLSTRLGDDKTSDGLWEGFGVVYNNLNAVDLSQVNLSDRAVFEKFIDDLEYRFVIYKDNGETELAEGPRSIFVAKDDFRSKNSLTDALSVYLYLYFDYFKPVLLATRFSVIQSSCDQLGIELPELPKNRDYKGAMMWYHDICGVFNAFQKENEMTDAEFCAALYGLGPSLKDESERKPFPKPVNVWLTGAGKDDVKDLARSMDNDSLWACNENTRRGDIVVLYALSPNSCIHSIWRADSEGTFNPFDYYQCRTRVSDGVRVSPISLAEMKADPEFGRLPMLNNNLQGVNGKRLPSWAYSALLRMIAAKGDDMSKIPVLFEAQNWDPGAITSEHDVEEKILIPALRDLGYTEDDWTRQLRLKAGRGEKAIPDFVFFPYGEEHAENAPLVIEAKWHMASEKERNDNYRQGRSYAKMLESEFLGLCDDERLILYRRTSNGTFNYTSPEFEAVWAAIAGDGEVHDRLMRLIGADVIRTKVRR